MLFFPQFESTCGSGPLGAGDPKGTRHLMVSICPDRAFQNKQVWFSTTLQGAASYLSVCLMRGKERAFECTVWLAAMLDTFQFKGQRCSFHAAMSSGLRSVLETLSDSAFVSPPGWCDMLVHIDCVCLELELCDLFQWASQPLNRTRQMPGPGDHLLGQQFALKY